MLEAPDSFGGLAPGVGRLIPRVQADILEINFEIVVKMFFSVVYRSGLYIEFRCDPSKRRDYC